MEAMVSRYKNGLMMIALSGAVLVGCAQSTGEAARKPTLKPIYSLNFAGLQETVAYVEAVQTAAYVDALHAASVRPVSNTGGGKGCYRAAPVYKEGDQYGGSSVPANIVARESGGDYSAINCGSRAGGRYQVLPSTWNGYGGYAEAQDAPPEVQDAWAEEAWAAAGCRPWGGC